MGIRGGKVGIRERLSVASFEKLGMRGANPMNNVKRIKGVILCGGLGSRLRPLSYYIPKSMVPIGRDEWSLLEPQHKGCGS